MTTIAYDGISIAADSMGICDSVIVALNDTKLHVTAKGILGCAGEAATVPTLIQWIETGKKEGAYSGTGILVDGRRALLFEGLTKGQKIKAPYAIGTGASFAFAAMYAGASAVEAVKIACRLDPTSGGRIVSKQVK